MAVWEPFAIPAVACFVQSRRLSPRVKQIRVLSTKSSTLGNRKFQDKALFFQSFSALNPAFVCFTFSEISPKRSFIFRICFPWNFLLKLQISSIFIHVQPCAKTDSNANLCKSSKSLQKIPSISSGNGGGLFCFTVTGHINPLHHFIDFLFTNCSYSKGKVPIPKNRSFLVGFAWVLFASNLLLWN